MASPPSSSSSSSASSPSPVLEEPVKVELSLDSLDDMTFADPRPDPLEFLFQTLASEATEAASSQDTNTPEWSQMATWESTDNRFNLGSDFDFSIPMDLDFQSNMAIDPSALHFNPSVFSQPAVAPQHEGIYTAVQGSQYTAAPTTYPFDAQANSWSETTTQRRLSITSASSSSGSSLSPVPEHSNVISSSASDSGYSEGDSASELAHRVRQLAGVTLAVPVSAQVQQLAAAGECILKKFSSSC